MDNVKKHVSFVKKSKWMFMLAFFVTLIFCNNIDVHAELKLRPKRVDTSCGDKTCPCGKYEGYTQDTCNNSSCVDGCRGHAYYSVAATCTTPGATKCSKCDYYEEKSDEPALGHDYGSWEPKEKTVTGKNGEHKGKCQRQGCNATTTESCANTYGSWLYENDTQHAKTCSKCNGKKLGGHGKGTNEQDRRGYSVTKSPSCTAEGEATWYCKEETCTKKYTESIKAIEHPYSSWSKTNDSIHTRTCFLCNDKQEAAHNSTTILSCTPIKDQPGYHQRYCIDCRDYITEECGSFVDSSQNVVKNPTCTEPGSETAKCQRCNGTMTVTKGAALGHNMSGWKQTSDSHYKICERSGCSHRENQGSHSMGSWTYENESQCYQKCSVCSYKNPQNHTLGSWQTDGTYHWKVCSKCQSSVGKVEHAWSSWTQLDGDYCK